MAIPVARVHLKVAHAALPALLPTPANWKMLPLLPSPCAAAILPKPFLAMPGRADNGERWDAHKTKPAQNPSTSSSPHSTSASSVRMSSAGRGSSRKSATSPPMRPGRADSAERWDAHKKAASAASLSSGTSSIVRSKCSISRASSAGRWDDVHKKPHPPQADQQLDDGESSSNYMDTEEEEILWKPRAMYAGPGFVGATPEPSMLPMPTAF